MRRVDALTIAHQGILHLGGVTGLWLMLGRSLEYRILIGPALIRGAEFSLAERRAFLRLLLLHFLGRGKARGAPGEALVAMADAWVSLVSAGEVRDFVWALRDFNGVSRGLTQLSRVCTGVSL